MKRSNSDEVKIRMTVASWLNSDLFLCEGEPVNTRSGFRLAEEIVEELCRRIFGFLCRRQNVTASAAAPDFRKNLLRATRSKLGHPESQQ